MKTSHRWVAFGGLVLVLPGASAADGQERRGRGRWSRMVDWDTDGDGAISRTEFQGPEQFFDRLDANGDGALDTRELQSMGRRGRDGRGGQDGQGGRGGRGGQGGRGGGQNSGSVGF